MPKSSKLWLKQKKIYCGIHKNHDLGSLHHSREKRIFSWKKTKWKPKQNDLEFRFGKKGELIYLLICYGTISVFFFQLELFYTKICFCFALTNSQKKVENLFGRTHVSNVITCVCRKNQPKWMPIDVEWGSLFYPFSPPSLSRWSTNDAEKNEWACD